MPRTIQVTRSAQSVIATPATPGTSGVVGNFTLSYVQQYAAAGGVLMPNEVFKLNQRPLDPTNPAGPQASDFLGVCTPFDLTALSVNAPGVGQTAYRAAAVTVTFGNQDDADVNWAAVKADVQTLKSALDAADRLGVLEVFTPV